MGAWRAPVFTTSCFVQHKLVRFLMGIDLELNTSHTHLNVYALYASARLLTRSSLDALVSPCPHIRLGFCVGGGACVWGGSGQVHAGDIDTAIQRLNDLNPEILETNPLLLFRFPLPLLMLALRQGSLLACLLLIDFLSCPASC